MRWLLGIALAVFLAAPARAEIRLAAATDCPTNPNCVPGLKRVYGVDATPHLFKLKVADAGVEALDNGVAQVAVVFSSNPELSRPDIRELRDDKHMIGPDHIVPVVRNALLKRYPKLPKALNAASALLSTLDLRGLNQEVIDGRLPEAVGGEFVDSNGLGGSGHRIAGPRIVVGYQSFDENKTLAYMYAEALRGAGYRVTVRSGGGLRRQTVHSLRTGKIDLYPEYSGSLRAYLGGKTLRAATARIHAQPLKLAEAQDRNTFAMKIQTAQALHISTLSDLARAWTTAHLSSEPLQGEQWAVAEGSVLNLPGAWAISQGAGVTVATIDSGALLQHPDLAPNIWTNFREIPGNGIDDDGNGYVDDVHGVDLTSTSPGQNLNDDFGHGTHVAGIISAAANGRGVVGIAPQAKLMIVKVLDAQGAGTTGGVAEGIRYAAANGARIINASIQSDTPDPQLNAAVAAANAANALVVVSAGNSSRNIDAQPSFPAAIAAPNLIAVAATAPEDGRDLDSYSNYGRLTVGLAAPGGQILSTTNDGGYGYKSGTSMAAPMVSGVAALMAAANPNLSASDLRGLLLQHAVRSNLPVGAGYLDALDSVLSATTAVGYNSTQPPRVKILRATTQKKRVQLQVAVVGARQAIKTYRVTIDRKPVASLPARSPLFNVTLPRRGKKAQIAALDASGRPLAVATKPVSALRPGKRGVKGGHGVGT